jgi:hypothetical protein
MSKMKADTWKTILQIAISVLTALATSLEFRVVWDSVSKQSIRIEIPFLKYFFLYRMFFIRL